MQHVVDSGDVIIPRDWPNLSVDEAQGIVAQATRQYFDSRRSRIDGFVDEHFSLVGTLALHRKALGWDVLRAPVNIALAIPYIGAQLTARVAGRVGATRLSKAIASRKILLETAVSREIEWLLMTELLELPFRQGSRVARKDALAETILESPAVRAALADTFDAVNQRVDRPDFREEVERMVATYTETRVAAAEITTAMVTMASGAAALKQLTPGAMVLGPALAGVIAYDAAVASFPFGPTLGGVWYSLFPVTASRALVFGLTGGLMAASAIVAAFSGIIADPVQRSIGLHRRRLLRLIDALETQFDRENPRGFFARDHYVARLLTLFELLSGIYRLAKP